MEEDHKKALNLMAQAFISIRNRCYNESAPISEKEKMKIGKTADCLHNLPSFIVENNTEAIKRVLDNKD